MSDPGLVSVVMPVFDGADTLDEQLASLAAQDYDGAWELLIADNGSRDESRAIVERWRDRFAGLRVVDASARQGCAPADNIGATVAHGAHLVFCDQDDVVQPGWLAAMASALREHDLVAGTNDFTLVNDVPPVSALPVTTGGSATSPAPQSRDFYAFLPFGLSCNLGVSRAAFEAVGGFDESLTGGDDVDLCWRLQLAGYPLHVESRAVVAKRSRQTSRSVWDQHFNYGVHDVVLFRKFRTQGMPRRLERGLRRYAWLIVHLPDLAARRTRLSWVRVAAGQAGRLVGSLRSRTLYL